MRLVDAFSRNIYRRSPTYQYLKSGDLVTYKKYLYTYRGLINAKWVAYKQTLPPIGFPEALNELKEIIPEGILKKLEEIITLKKQGKEQQIIQNIVRLDEYAENFLKNDEEAPKEKTHATLTDLNKELRKIVLDKYPHKNLA